MVERSDLLSGVQTDVCDYCWRIENLNSECNSELTSDRIYKSAADWAAPHRDEILKSGLGETYIPPYVEVSFENTCSLRCIYCSPEYSSRWVEDVKSNGPYKQVYGDMHSLEQLKAIDKLPYSKDEHNPYVEAFWKWWPDLYPKLNTFRITGGEPLLSKHTFEILDWIDQHPRNDLVLSINTNLCVPEKIMDKFIDKIKSIQDKVKTVIVFTSLESTGKQAEYIRDGLNYAQLLSNVNRLLSETKSNKVIVGFMTTITNLSVTTIIPFLRQLFLLKSNFSKFDNNRVQYLLNYLRYPTFLDIRNLPPNVKEKTKNDLNAFKSAVMENNELYYTEDFNQIDRLVAYMMSEDIVEHEHENFNMFIKQYDERRGLNFLDTFPELAELIRV